jgi:hypothetical protein
MKRLIIQLIIILTAIIIIVILFAYMRFHKKESERWRDNYFQTCSVLEITEDNLGRTQRQVSQLILTKKELTSELSQQDSTISLLTRELKASNVKIRHLEWVMGSSVFSGNSGVSDIDTVFVSDTVYRFPRFKVDDGNLNFLGEIRSLDSVVWDYTYSEEIISWSEMVPTLYDKNGDKRRKVWVFLFPRRSPKMFIKSTNPRSMISSTKIEIKD